MDQPKMSGTEYLESIFGKRIEELSSDLRGILQTKDYDRFMILSDTGELLHEFNGSKAANRCLPGDHVSWINDQCELELRDQHPPIVGTLELTNKSTYGMTKRKHLMYLFTPYDKKYPHFIVGSSEKDRSKNKIVVIAFDDWTTTTFPRGNIQHTLGTSGDEQPEKEALIWQASPWRYPTYNFEPEFQSNVQRVTLTGHTFHIDPEGCRDVDDVFTFEPCGDGWKVTITISDVSSYVEDGGAIDIMASLIGQTLYDTEGHMLRPMLPAEYSEKTCSLLPGKESYGVSFQFVWTGTEIIQPVWFHSRLCVDSSYTYDEFQTCDSPFRTPLQAIASYLAKEQVNDAHDWVAQMMILYNTEAGKKLKEAEQGILRRHTAPNREKLERYRTHLPELERLAFASAEYCLAEEQDTQHYGLTTDTYAHASSPIRRYADLVNQRVLSRLLQGMTERYIVPQAMYDMNMRQKAIKRFARDTDFLYAIQTGHTRFSGTIMDVVSLNESWVKIKIYVPSWKRMISTRYRRISENLVISRDETHEIDITLYRVVQLHCAFSPNARNWKERAVIHMA
jgi:exoribonuclease R